MKLTKLKFSVLIMIFILTGCEKSNQSDCEVNRYGTITISNSSSNPYDIDIDGVFQVRIEGKTISNKININEGNDRKLHCIQVSGYLFFPTEKTSSFNVLRCSDYSWQIP